MKTLFPLLLVLSTLSSASAADWSTRPPLVAELTAEKLARPLAQGTAQIQAQFADQGLAVLPLHLDRTVSTLRDDGQRAEPVAGASRDAAIHPLDAGPLAAWARKEKQQPALLDREGRFPGHRFEGRKQAATASVPAINLAAWDKGLPNVLRILPPANPPRSKRTPAGAQAKATNRCSAAGDPEGKPAALSSCRWLGSRGLERLPWGSLFTGTRHPDNPQLSNDAVGRNNRRPPGSTWRNPNFS